MKLKTSLTSFLSLTLMVPLLSSCSFKEMAQFKAFEKKAADINHYQKVSLTLAKENRELRTHIKRLEFEIEKLKQETAFKHAAKTAESGERKIASIGSESMFDLKGERDQVEFKTYKWSAEDMLKIADKEFKEKNFEKAAQFYNSIIENYPSFTKVDDELLYKAGVSAFETGKHHDWTFAHFNNLLKLYPKSAHHRSAKLWVALTNLKVGEKDKFLATVEEFRKKYRNTNEWKILSSYYESIIEKTNE